MRSYVIAALTLGLAASAASAQSGAYWDYYGKTGPLAWGKLDPAYRACSKGHEQSPIDIRGARLNKSLQPLEFHYIAGSVTIENDGRMIIVHASPGSFIVANGVRYELKRLEFHHPSEEAVRGKLTDLGVELIHESSDGKIAIVNVRLAMDRGNPNAVLAMLWPHLPKKPGTTEKIAEMVNAGGFLPADRGYWTYMGSLPTPPCTEGVRWFVIKSPATIGLNQIVAFGRLYPMNARPVQPLNKRKVLASE